MSEPVELAFRQRLVGAFAEELGERVYGVVSPPEAKTPAATFRRLQGGGRSGDWNTAVIGLTLRDEEYTRVKRLQKRIEEYFAGLRNTWLGEAGEDCSVWVYQIEAATGQDGYQGNTRHRVVSTVFTVRYRE